MKFSDLEVQGASVVVKNTKKQKEKLEKVRDVILGGKSEPGYKIPIADYQQVGQWCDVCEDVEAHVYSYMTKKIRCLKCRHTKQLK